MHRASTLSSNSVERVAKEKKVMVVLKDNGYPSSFIHRHLDNRTPRRTEDDQRLPRTSLTLPYIGGLSEAGSSGHWTSRWLFAYFALYAINWFSPRTLYQGTSGLEWCIRSPARIVPKSKLVSLG